MNLQANMTKESYTQEEVNGIKKDVEIALCLDALTKNVQEQTKSINELREEFRKVKENMVTIERLSAYDTKWINVETVAYENQSNIKIMRRDLKWSAGIISAIATVGATALTFLKDYLFK